MDDFVPSGYLALGQAINLVAERTQSGYAEARLSEEEADMLQAYRDWLARTLRPKRPAPMVPVPTVGYGGRSPAAVKTYEDRVSRETGDVVPPPPEVRLETVKGLLEKESHFGERRQAARLAAGKLLRDLLDAGTVSSVIIAKQGRRFDIEPEIWGGEEWYRALRSNEVRFAYGLSGMVSGRPLIPRDALEAAFNPDGAAGEEPGPSKSTEEEPDQQSGRKKPAKSMHDRWVAQAREMKTKEPTLGQSEITRRIHKQDSRMRDPHTKGATRDEGTIRRVLTSRQSEWIRPENS